MASVGCIAKGGDMESNGWWVALLITVGGLAAMWVFLMLVAMAYGVTA